MVPGSAAHDNHAMTATSLRNSVGAWQADAPWREWTRWRMVTVGLVLYACVALWVLGAAASFAVSWCGLFGAECSPEENRQMAIAGAVADASWLVAVATTVVVFLFRRRFIWLVPSLLSALLLAWAWSAT